MYTLFSFQLWLLTSLNALSGWSEFGKQFTRFFKDGLGGPGATAIGGAILVVGFVGAGVSFAIHKFNPQSRVPGWISLLMVGVFGAVLMTGTDRIFAAFETTRDFIFKVIGI